MLRYVGWTLIAMLASTSAVASAQETDCADLPNPTYGLGGSAQKPLIGRFAAKLAALSEPQTIIYSAPGACFGVSGLIEETNIEGTASYWTTDGTEEQCQLPVTGGVPIDFASSNVTATDCPEVDELPSTIREVEGPVSAVVFLVPAASTQQSISSEAAYYVFRFGEAADVAPWTNDELIFRRNNTSAVQVFASLATGVPVDAFVGVDVGSNMATITRLSESSTPEARIGFASAEFADLFREDVRPLAYQHVDQTCGYWPDSSATAFDKANVRSGQYYIWSAARFLARVNEGGTIIHEGARNLIGLITGAIAPTEEVPSLDLIIENGNVPQCAMHATREGTLGPIASYQPEEPCGCYYEQVATGESSSCTECEEPSDCPSSAPVCRYGFCEVQ